MTTNIFVSGPMGAGKDYLIGKLVEHFGVISTTKVMLNAVGERYRQGAHKGELMPTKYADIRKLTERFSILSSGDRDGTPLGLVEQIMELNANGTNVLTQRRNFGPALRPTYAQLLHDHLVGSIVYAILRVPESINIARMQHRRDEYLKTHPNRKWAHPVDVTVRGDIRGQVRAEQIARAHGFMVVDIPDDTSLVSLLKVINDLGMA